MTNATPAEKGHQLLNALRWEDDTGQCRKLIEDGADINIQDNGGWTALMIAIWKDRTDVIHTLIDAGANISTQGSDGWTALMLATNSNNSDAAKTLLDAGANTELKNNSGKTAQDIAEERNNAALAEALRAHRIRKTFSAAADAGTTKRRKVLRHKIHAAKGVGHV
ncbi:MAG: ankyrin repeat domain-containing protein [Alphaproteobacteria bacterium]|nr:ankyrin repeat domain-containing protein [Alphaproteobacteria bacterium]